MAKAAFVSAGIGSLLTSSSAFSLSNPLPSNVATVRGTRGRGIRMSDNPEGNHLAKEIKNLLVVRASASVQFYWLEFNDDLKPRWLKSFEQREENCVQKNGWDVFLANLMREEPEEFVLKHLSQKPRGGSGNNPYLSSNRHQIEYTVVVDPQAIAKNIMTVREQIALEWRHDLGLLREENAELQRHHEDTVSLSVNEAERSRQMVFDHDPLSGTQSPYRGRNYRELVTLATNIAVQRAQTELRVSDRYSQNWIEQFMVKGGKGLEGNKLVEAMLNGPMVMINAKITSGRTKVVEPRVVAKIVMEHRARVAEEFCVYLEDVPNDHSQLKRKMLESFFKKGQLSETVLAGRRDLGFEPADEE